MNTITQTNRVLVGQEVAVRERRSGWHYNPGYQFGYTVTKVTPSGQLVIERTRADGSKQERRFKPVGKYGRPGTYTDIGASSEYTKVELVLDVAAARAEVAAYEIKQAAASALQEAASNAHKLSQANPGWDKDTMLTALANAEAYIAAARLAVNRL